MKKFLYLLAFLPCTLFAQHENDKYYRVEESERFEHLEVGATLGTTGIGIDVATPMGNSLRLRAGISFMPSIKTISGYTMKSVGGEYVDDKLSSKTERLAEILGDMINNKNIDDVVDMQRSINYYNARVILDWFPWKGKNWHVSAGFLWGGTMIAKVRNTVNEGATATAIVMYNNMYDQIQTLGKYEYPTISVGSHHYELDPIAGKEVKEAFNYYGRVAVQLGETKDGAPFYTEPNENAVLKADAYTNAIKPYIGFGYSTRLFDDERWSLGFDAGIIYWGTPHIYSSGYIYHKDAATYEEKIEHVDKICLIHDLNKTSGSIGSDIKLLSKMPIFPVLEVKLSYNIF